MFLSFLCLLPFCNAFHHSHAGAAFTFPLGSSIFFSCWNFSISLFRVTIFEIWCPVGPTHNGRGTGAPALVLDWAAQLWWGYSPFSFFSWFSLDYTQQAKGHHKTSYSSSGMPLMVCQSQHSASLVGKGLLWAEILVCPPVGPDTPFAPLSSLADIAWRGRKKEVTLFWLRSREQCPLSSSFSFPSISSLNCVTWYGVEPVQ